METKGNGPLLGKTVLARYGFGVCDDCGMPTVGSSNGPLCNCSTSGGRRAVPGPVDLAALAAMGKPITEARAKLATQESLERVRDVYMADLDGCFCEDYDGDAVQECQRCEENRAVWRICQTELDRRRDGTKRLNEETEAMVKKMQTPQARSAARRAFEATPEELGQAAVDGARRSKMRLEEERARLADSAARELFRHGCYSEEQAVRQLLLEVDELRRENEGLRAAPVGEPSQLESRVKSAENDAALRYRQALRAEDDLRAEREKIQKLEEEAAELRRRLSRAEQPTWTSQDGKVLFPDAFRSGHLVNTIRFIERRFAQSCAPALKLPVPTWDDVRGHEDRDLLAKAELDPELGEVCAAYPVYPFLLAEARRRNLTIEAPPVAEDPPSFEVRHEGLKIQGVGRRSRYSVYLPAEVPISEDVYWAINERVAEDGECVLKVEVAP